MEVIGPKGEHTSCHQAAPGRPRFGPGFRTPVVPVVARRGVFDRRGAIVGDAASGGRLHADGGCDHSRGRARDDGVRRRDDDGAGARRSVREGVQRRRHQGRHGALYGRRVRRLARRRRGSARQGRDREARHRALRSEARDQGCAHVGRRRPARSDAHRDHGPLGLHAERTRREADDVADPHVGDHPEERRPRLALPRRSRRRSARRRSSRRAPPTAGATSSITPRSACRRPCPRNSA
jgi:hypothetical protein